MFFVWYASIPVAFVFKDWNSHLEIHCQRQALTSTEQYWQHKWFVEFKLYSLWEKLIALLSMVEYTCASLILTSFNDVSSLVFVDHKYLTQTGPLVRALFYSSIEYIGVTPWLDAVVKDFAFVQADQNSVSISCFLQSLSELLELFFTASQHIDVVHKPQPAKWLSTDGHWWQWGVNFFCIFYCIWCHGLEASRKLTTFSWSMCWLTHMEQIWVISAGRSTYAKEWLSLDQSPAVAEVSKSSALSFTGIY